MARLDAKSFEEPDELLELPLLLSKIVNLGEVQVAWTVAQPGWRWSEHVKPIVGTPSCEYHHRGVHLSGMMRVETDSGATRVIGPGQAFEIPPGHDAWVEGDEAAVTIEIAGVRGFGKPPETGERVVATLLVTDIAGSTALASQLGDAAWKQLLGRHADRTRLELDRFRGREIATTGDGFLAVFDGAARAVRCAAALIEAAAEDGLELRAGVHTGEVEREAGNLRGVAVHAATRVAGAAGPGEVFVSAAATGLLEGSDIALADAGDHELKGLPGKRRLYRVAG
jgi:class 3 adenylate cyclase